MVGGSLYIPYAIEIDGQIIVLYDPVYHRPDDAAGAAAGRQGAILLASREPARPALGARARGRWCSPAVSSRSTSSTSGTILHQALPGAVPGEGQRRRADHRRLRAPAGAAARPAQPVDRAAREAARLPHAPHRRQVPDPVRLLLVIATNIDPKQLVEEAFLRRIHYKIRVESPTVEQYERDLPALLRGQGHRVRSAGAVRQVYKNFYHAHSIAPRGCHPRDIIDHLWTSRATARPSRASAASSWTWPAAPTSWS